MKTENTQDEETESVNTNVEEFEVTIPAKAFREVERLLGVKGTKEETSELNINLKTLTRAFLREETPFIKISFEEDQLIKGFEKSSANFKAFRDLFGVE